MYSDLSNKCPRYNYLFNNTASTEIYPYSHTLSLHDALPICQSGSVRLAPISDNVRRHFAWMDASGADVLKTAFDVLKDEGLLTYGTARDRLTVDWVEQQDRKSVV